MLYGKAVLPFDDKIFHLPPKRRPLLLPDLTFFPAVSEVSGAFVPEHPVPPLSEMLSPSDADEDAPLNRRPGRAVPAAISLQEYPPVHQKTHCSPAYRLRFL